MAECMLARRIFCMNTIRPPSQQTASVGITGNPGKPVFTPDGKFGLVPNLQAAANQDLVTLIRMDTVTKVNAVSVNSFPNVKIDTLLVENNTTVLAFSSSSEALAQLNIGNAGNSFSISTPLAGGLILGFVRGVALSNEVAFLPGTGPGTTAHYLFLATSDKLYKIDLTTNTEVASTPLTDLTIGALEYVALPSTQSPAAILLYGDGQNVLPNGKTLPLVVLVLDQNGKPVSGATVTFGANVNTASLSPTSATTGTNGLAQTILTAPPVNGKVVVTVTVGNVHQQAFTITAGTGSTTNSALLQIIAGQGQLLAPQTNSGSGEFGSPLTVLVTDLNNKPVKGAPVVFAIAPGSGGGTIFGAGANGLTVNTAADGTASVSFVSPSAGRRHERPDYYQCKIGRHQPGDLLRDDGPAPDRRLLAGAATGNRNTTVHGARPAQIIKNAFKVAVSDEAAFNLQFVSIRTCLPTVLPDETVECNPPPDGTQPFGTCVDPTGAGAPLSDAKGILTCDLKLNGVVGTGFIGWQVGYHEREAGHFQADNPSWRSVSI